MIAGPLPLSAVEISHVTINLENHQFHTVPSKFSNHGIRPLNSSPWYDPKWPRKWPQMTLRLIKSFRRCLSLCSPGMMNSRMRGLRERNRSVNDYNIPKKDLNPALMDQPDLTGDFKRMLSLPSTTSGKHQDLKVIWPQMTSIWPLRPKITIFTPFHSQNGFLPKMTPFDRLWPHFYTQNWSFFDRN